MNRNSLSLSSLIILLCVLLVAGAGCRNRSGQKQGVRPRTLRDVPAGRLAYSFAPDVDAPQRAAENTELLSSIQNDFTTKRVEEALLRTIVSPDKQRALAVYATGEDQPNEFRIDLYGADGNFLRHITPPGLAVVFAPAVSWSPDGNYVAFIAYKSATPQPTPTPLEELLPEVFPSPIASPSAQQSTGAGLQLFNTEQIYFCNRDGFDLRPLTTRDGLIYFYLAWSPDSQQLAALACRENEWRERPMLPAGRPRIISIGGQERLLDDGLTDVLPAWSPDASKVATAFETNLRIYDALGDAPTRASIPLGDALLAASRVYDEKARARDKSSGDSFHPITALEWPQPDALYLQTGYVRNFENQQIRNFMRWHLTRLSAQAALLG